MTLFVGVSVKDSNPPPRCSDIYGKVVFDNTLDPEHKYVRHAVCCDLQI